MKVIVCGQRLHTMKKAGLKVICFIHRQLQSRMNMQTA